VASVLQLALAQTSSIDVDESSLGFRLNKHVRGARKLSETGEVNEDSHLRRWKEEDYQALMSAISGQGNLRHRRTQGNSSSSYQKKPYYTASQTRVAKWQKAALGTLVTATAFLAFYVYALKKELSSLNQYLPLGYKLFSDAGEMDEEEEMASNGVEMN